MGVVTDADAHARSSLWALAILTRSGSTGNASRSVETRTAASSAACGRSEWSVESQRLLDDLGNVADHLLDGLLVQLPLLEGVVSLHLVLGVQHHGDVGVLGHVVVLGTSW